MNAWYELDLSNPNLLSEWKSHTLVTWVILLSKWKAGRGRLARWNGIEWLLVLLFGWLVGEREASLIYFDFSSVSQEYKVKMDGSLREAAYSDGDEGLLEILSMEIMTLEEGS
jgi:hypothetical protein